MPLTKTAEGINSVNETNTSAMHRKEAELIDRIGKADENALKELYCLYYSRLFRFISRINGGDYLDEIINDVMYVVWKKAHTYNQSCLPSTWIFGIAYNKARQSIRTLQKGMEESLDMTETESFQLGTADYGLMQLETSDWLEEAFKSLSPEQRAVVELTYVQGMNYREIAKLMDCSENTVKTRMFYSRKKLSKVFRGMRETS